MSDVDQKDLSPEVKNKLKIAEIELNKKLEEAENAVLSDNKKYLTLNDFVINSLLEMRIDRNQQIYNLAIEILNSSKYNVRTKIGAISLFTRHGEKKDIPLILSYMDEIDNKQFRERSLIVIGNILSKSFLKKENNDVCRF